MFVTGEPVAVTIGDNTIYVKRKMDFGTKSAVEDELIDIHSVPGGMVSERHLGAYNVALLVHNIVSWTGPAFTGTACTPENIRHLDPGEPLVDLVLAKIQELNLEGRDPKGAASGGGSTTSAAA